jgi:hypothetical protein
MFYDFNISLLKTSYSEKCSPVAHCPPYNKIFDWVKTILNL